MVASLQEALQNVPLEMKLLMIPLHICLTLQQAPLLLSCPVYQDVHLLANFLESALSQMYLVSPVKVIKASPMPPDEFLASLVLRHTNTLPKVLIIQNVQKLNVQCQEALSAALRDRRIIVNATYRETPDTPVWRPTSGLYTVPDDFGLICISAAQRSTAYLGLDQNFVDRFCMAANVDIQDAALWSKSPLDICGAIEAFHTAALLKLREKASSIHCSPIMKLYIYDLLSATRHNMALSNRNLTARANRDLMRTIDVWACLFGNGQDVTPSDAAPFISVLAHRLTVRKPEDRLSYMFFGQPLSRNTDETVAEILQHILNEV